MSSVLAPPRLTPDEFLRLPADETAGFELVNGELEENPMSVESNLLGGEMFGHLWVWSKSGPGGRVFPQDSLFRCFPDDEELVRKPDVAYIGLGRLKADQLRDGFCTIAPDLVVEVLSPHDLASRVNVKVGEWLDAGVKLIWVVDPESQTVQVFSTTGPNQRLRDPDVLTAGTVLPGFSLPIATLFHLSDTVTKP